MTNNWSTRKLIAAASLSALYVILSVPAFGLTLISGTPALSGVINTFIQSVVIVLVAFIMQTRGAIVLVATLYGILTLPFPSLGGPGFLPKVVIVFIAGLVTEVIYHLTRKNKKVSAVIMAIIFPLSTGVSLIYIGTIAGIPGMEKTAQLLFSPILIPYIIVFGLLGLLSLWIYGKLEKTAVVQRIQHEK